MGRPPLEVGSAGEVSVTKRSELWVATCRFRDSDGVTRKLERSGPTKGVARRLLNEAVRQRGARTVGLNAESRVAELMSEWLEWKLDAEPLSATSRARYRDIIRRFVIPGLGQLRLREATVPVLDKLYVSTWKRTPVQADLMKTVLMQSFSYATRHGAIGINPVPSLSKLSKPTKPVRVLSMEELSALRDAVRNMPLNTWLEDIFETQMGLALRIGEVLALTVDDLELEFPDAPRVRIVASVVTPAGEKHFRQPHTKDGVDGRRTLTAPDWVAEILGKRASMAGPSGLLFASRNDTLLDPHNVRESWNHIRGAAGLEWMTPHSLRKTSLSKINEVFGLEKAQEFADHKTSAVTQKYYIAKQEKFGPDVRDALDQLAPGTHSKE